MRQRFYLWRINHLPIALFMERRLWKGREYRYYYCNWWCFLTNQRLCKWERNG